VTLPSCAPKTQAVLSAFSIHGELSYIRFDSRTVREIRLIACDLRDKDLPWISHKVAKEQGLLDETGAPMKVQQELMRHADIRTTMNVYGKAMDASKREAHGKVVRLVLASKVA